MCFPESCAGHIFFFLFYSNIRDLNSRRNWHVFSLPRWIRIASYQLPHWHKPHKWRTYHYMQMDSGVVLVWIFPLSKWISIKNMRENLNYILQSRNYSSTYSVINKLSKTFIVHKNRKFNESVLKWNW